VIELEEQMSETGLGQKVCRPCEGGTPPLETAQIAELMTQVPGWDLSDDHKTIQRRIEVKGFAKAVELANLAAWLGNKQGHHPDVRFGWGYCEVRFTTHAAKGLTENDFICAARLNDLLA
jgi:4a-hydroxytetrahydrobiopterin dehydratase